MHQPPEWNASGAQPPAYAHRMGPPLAFPARTQLLARLSSQGEEEDVGQGGGEACGEPLDAVRDEAGEEAETDGAEGWSQGQGDGHRGCRGVPRQSIFG